MPDATTAQQPDYHLHCQQCPQRFYQMLELIEHREQVHEMRPPRPRALHRPASGTTALTPGTPKGRQKTAAGAA